MLFAFSSYTKGRFPVTAIQKYKHHTVLTIALSQFFKREDGSHISFKEKLNKKKKCFFPTSALQIEIDGVAATVMYQRERQKQFILKAKIPASLYESTTLKNLHVQDKVSIGLPSMNNHKYLLATHPIATATLIKEPALAEGHDYTQELVFETSSAALPAMQHKWLGLNGSGFYIQKQETTPEQKIQFKIHIGNLTRERSVFGSPEMYVGQTFNLASAFVAPAQPIAPAVLFSNPKDERKDVLNVGKYELRGRSKRQR